MIRKLAEMLGYKDSETSDRSERDREVHDPSTTDPILSLPIRKDGEKPVIVRKPIMDRSKLKVDPAGSRLSLPFFPTDGKDVRYIKLTNSKKYLNYKKIMKEELL